MQDLICQIYGDLSRRLGASKRGPGSNPGISQVNPHDICRLTEGGSWGPLGPHMNVLLSQKNDGIYSHDGIYIAMIGFTSIR